MSKKEPNNTPPNRNRNMRNALWYILFTFILISIVTAGMNGEKAPDAMDYSDFLKQLNQGAISEITIRSSDQTILGKTKDGESFKTYYIENPNLISQLKEHDVTIKVNPADSNWFWSLFLQAVFPFLLIGGLWFFILRPAQGANSQAMSFGKSKAKAYIKPAGKDRITFKDVAGCDEAIEELREMVEYLKKPAKFLKIGAKIPKGALLVGPPGTGKTLLAKAVAGEADVPFFNISGSDFVEMFVGVGASRVRDLFSQAKKNAPAIIFVDEIDAVGRHRGAGLGGGHDEREQTLNQMLVEMDGFEDHQTVIVLAATNRPDILDPALLRPGRFDRQIMVDKPDIDGRRAILDIHAKTRKISKKVDLGVIARSTPGFTGADLANLINEAALLAARRSKTIVGQDEIEESIERVMAGPQRKSRIMSDKEKSIIAYHEVGHALVAAYLPDTDPVHKISILPRGMALGYTMQVPIEDKYLQSNTEILNNIRVLLGGRVAEQLIFNEITTGASNDIERATALAKGFVCSFGMSEKLGARKFGKQSGSVFLGKQYTDHSQDYSEATAKDIDDEVHRIIDEAYTDTTALLKKNMDMLKKVSKIILEREVIERDEFLELIGQAPKKKPAKKRASKKTDDAAPPAALSPAAAGAA
ncbi:MAG: ATP-dependent zinc metalloprotease FtsH [bacterium]|nr:ATP-dependent zinc metalloprotease FtsH [bacterium]